MNNDLYEYRTFREETQKTENEKGIYIDDQRVNEILYRLHSYGKDAYWSYHKLGKGPSAFKTPFQDSKEENEVKIEEDIFGGEDYNFVELGNIDTESLDRPVGDVFKGPYWSLFNIGKSPSVYKDPKLKDDGTKKSNDNELKLEKFKTE